MFIGGDPMKPATNSFTGSIEQLGRGADLLQHAQMHHRDAICQRHRLQLIMGDVERGHAEASVEALQLGPHVGAQPRVEMRDRLVHDEQAGLADDRPADPDALLLSAAEVLDAARQEIDDREDLRDLVDAAVDLGRRQAARAQGRRDVVVDVQVRIERVVLEHHRDVALAWGDVVHAPAVHQQVARGDRLEPGHHPHRRGLAAAGRAEQAEELAVAQVSDRSRTASTSPYFFHTWRSSTVAIAPLLL